MTDLSDLIGRHPCPPGYTPRKSELGQLVGRYGVGNIPLEELHRANTVTPGQWAAMRAKANKDARALAASAAAADRHDQMAVEWEATHGGR